MKRIRGILILILLIPFALIGCVQQTKQNPADTPQTPQQENPYLSQYSGTYEVMVKGYPGTDTETFVLNRSGSSSWTASMGTLKSTKRGTWTAKEGEIIITVQGNTGEIVETFKLQGGIFVSTMSPDRYLVKQ